MVAPPTPPQLEQDKKAIDDSFEKAFSLLEQLSKDTESLKDSERARTERLDAALAEVESVIGDLKTASRRREEESRRISDEVRGFKDLIPKAIEGQKETTDTRLRELNTELKSLKTLMGQRMNPASSTSTNMYGRTSGIGGSAPGPTVTQTSTSINGSGTSAGDSATPKPALVSNGAPTESVPSLLGRTSSPFNTGAPAGRAAIPSWQMAAANKTTSPVTSTGSGSGSQETSSTS
jgi:peroxin-14